MSTAVLEPPKETIAAEPPIAGAPPATPEAKAAFLKTIFPAAKVEAKMPEAKAVEKVVEKKDEVVPSKEAPKVDTVPTDAEKNFAALRTKAEAAEAARLAAIEERDKFKAEMEEIRKRPASEDFVKELEQAKKERAEYQRELRIAALSRDPEFNRKYQTGIQTAMQQMVDTLAASGIDKAEATKAVTGWNEQQFAAWMDDGLDSVAKMRFSAAMQRALELDAQKHSELANAEQTWQGLQKQREAEAKTQQDQYLAMLRGDIDAAVKDAGETELGKLHADAMAEAKALAFRAAGLEGERLPNRELLGLVAKSHLLARGFQKQAEALTEKEKEIAELKKTLEERDAFIKDKHGAIPGISGTVATTKPDAKALAKALMNPTIG